MQELDQDTVNIPIRDIDLMARAAYTWVRQQIFEQCFIGIPVSSMEESELAAGFLAGLQTRLKLGNDEIILLAYVYALMMGKRAGAIGTARNLIDRDSAALISRSSYLHGLAAAREILLGHPEEKAKTKFTVTRINHFTNQV